MVSTFSSHLSRTHKQCTARDISNSLTLDSGAVMHAECSGEQAENIGVQ